MSGAVTTLAEYEEAEQEIIDLAVAEEQEMARAIAILGEGVVDALMRSGQEVNAESVYTEQRRGPQLVPRAADTYRSFRRRTWQRAKGQAVGEFRSIGSYRRERARLLNAQRERMCAIK